MTKFIQLDRRFLEWSEHESTDPELRSPYGGHQGETWDELLLRPRVVVLAEAGSGKSEELKAQATRKTNAGAFAFYATVQDVARKGLEAALHPRHRARLAAWRSSNEMAWFFID